MDLELYLTEDHIIRGEVVETKVVGYDILSEEIVSVDKTECIPLPKSVLSLLKNEGAKFRLAVSIEPKLIESCKILDVSSRTMHRLSDTYN